MNAIDIQLINVNDVELLREVAVKAYCDHYLNFWYDEGNWYLEKSFSIDQLQKELSDTGSQFYLLYYEEAPVGFLKINLNAAFDSEPGENALELERIYLNKTATGKKIGERAVAFTIDLARKLGKQLVWLKVMDSSHGPTRFYEKMGFEKCGTYKLNFLQMKEELRGMFIMKMSL